MSKKVDKPRAPLTFDEMVDQGVKVIFKSLGKGKDLRSTVSLIIMSAAAWGAENVRRAEREGNKEVK